MGIADTQEIQEFALFLIKGEGEPREKRAAFRSQPLSTHKSVDSVLCSGLAWVSCTGELVRPLSSHEYLNNVVTDQDMSLHTRRLGWETPLHFDNPTYIETHYGQVSLLPRPSVQGH